MSPNGWDSTIDLAGIGRRIEAAAERGVLLGAEHVLSEATKVVPIEEGTLATIWRAEPAKSRAAATARARSVTSVKRPLPSPR